MVPPWKWPTMPPTRSAPEVIVASTVQSTIFTPFISCHPRIPPVYFSVFEVTFPVKCKPLKEQPGPIVFPIIPPVAFLFFLSTEFDVSLSLSTVQLTVQFSTRASLAFEAKPPQAIPSCLPLSVTSDPPVTFTWCTYPGLPPVPINPPMTPQLWLLEICALSNVT